MKTILAPLMGGESDPTQLSLVHAVAQRFGAHIDVLHVRRNPVEEVMSMTMGQGVVAQEAWETIEGEIQDRSNKAQTCFDQFCTVHGLSVTALPKPGCGVSAAWRTVEGVFAAKVIESARIHDLVILEAAAQPLGITPACIAEILLQSGCPILLTPPKVTEADLGTVAIAWNDSAEAARAVSLAMPFLKAAGHVCVLAASEHGDIQAAADAAGRLALRLRWHGIDPTVECIPARKGNVTAAIREPLHSKEVDLLVMGGYGHSRAREFVLGGVTRDLLEDCDIPLFIAH